MRLLRDLFVSMKGQTTRSLSLRYGEKRKCLISRALCRIRLDPVEVFERYQALNFIEMLQIPLVDFMTAATLG